MKRLLTCILSILIVLSTILAVASCERLDNGPITESELLDGKTPKDLYGQSINKYKKHKDDKIPYSVKAVWSSVEAESASTTIEIFYDGDSFKYIITENDGDLSFSEEIIYHGGKMYYKDKEGGKHSYNTDHDKANKYLNDHTKVKHIIPAFPDNIPNSWFDDIKFIPSEDGEYYTVTADSKKPKNHPLYKDFYESEVICKVYFTKEGILSKIELENVTINGEKSDLTLYFSWKLDNQIGDPDDKDKYPDKGDFDPDKGHKPGDDNRPVAPEITYSEGLEFTSNGDGTCYVSGMGTCKDSHINIPPVSPDQEEVISIGFRAIFNNDSVEHIRLPYSVVTLESMSINRCTNLSSITVDEKNPAFKSVDGNLYSIDSKVLVLYAVGKTETSFAIPDGVETIGRDAFNSSLSLERIIIPNGVTKIESYVFWEATSLKDIVMSNTVETIDKLAFSSCYATSIYYTGTPDEWSNISIGEYNNPLLNATIYYYSDTTPTTEGDFWHYVDGVPAPWPTYVDPEVSYSEGLKFTSNGDGTCFVSGIGSCADSDLIIPPVSPEGHKVTSIGEWAFECNNKLKSVILPNSITEIERCAFNSCGSLEYVTIPDSVISIDWEAFHYCISLLGFSVDSNNPVYESIDGNLYVKDDTLWQYALGKPDTSFVIPDGFYQLSSYAFSGCSTLTSITLSKDVELIGHALFDCSSLLNIIVPESNPYFESIDGNLYSKGADLFYQYAIGKKDTHFTIPSSVIRIVANSFELCESLTSITIPKSVTNIDIYAFTGCKGLKDIYYEGSAEEWENISIAKYNTPLLNATIYYYSDTPPTTEGNFWHYIDDVPIPWPAYVEPKSQS